MIKYFCDKCGKELPKDDKCDCKLTVTGFKGFDDTFNAIYCVECLKEIIGADNWDELVYKKEERRKRIKEREEERRKAAMGDANV